MEFEFKLTYKLPSTEFGTDQLLNKLGAAGCTDALVGLGVDGQVCLEFVREAASAEEAVRSALEDVKRALPDAERLCAWSDFVWLNEVLNKSPIGLQRLSAEGANGKRVEQF